MRRPVVECEPRTPRGYSFSPIAVSSAQIKFDVKVVPAKKVESTLPWSKPDMGPQLRPSARTAITRYAPYNDELRSMVI
jgi:hypothetical protein